MWPSIVDVPILIHFIHQPILWKARFFQPFSIKIGQTTTRRPQEEVSNVGSKHIGSDFDEFLEEDGRLGDAEAVAAKRVIAFQIAEEMKRAHITKSELARRMKTSRPAVERLLDPANWSVTLSTLERAASAVGRKLKIELSA